MVKPVIKKGSISFKTIAIFIIMGILSLQSPHAYASTLPFMPASTQMIYTGKLHQAPILRGIKIYPDNPFKFDFIINEGDSNLTREQLKVEADKLIRYFLAGLTIPEKDLWVNLSPYESNRIVPDKLGKTNLGRDMLRGDYVLKQLSSSLTYPENYLGRKFWDKVYAKAIKLYGKTNIPIDTFHKIWITPESATIYQDNDKAFVAKSKLKVMLEADYLAMNERQKINDKPQANLTTVNFSNQIMKEVILPEIEKEANQGENFAQLRQMYHSLLLANWYKNKLKSSIVNQVYADKKKIAGVDVDDPDIKEKIYNQYVEAFKQGVYDYIRKETDPATHRVIKRRYFSGGFYLGCTSTTKVLDIDPTEAIEQMVRKDPDKVTVVEIKLAAHRALGNRDIDRDISDQEAEGILRWHRHGKGKLGERNPDGTYQRLALEEGGYTDLEIYQKGRGLLKEVGLSLQEAQALMDYGVVGRQDDVDEMVATRIFKNNGFRPAPDKELCALINENLKIMPEVDLEKYIQKTHKYNKTPETIRKGYPGEYLIDKSADREIWWYTLRNDLRIIPVFFGAAESVGLTYEQALSLLYSLSDSNPNHEVEVFTTQALEYFTECFLAAREERYQVNNDDLELLSKTIKVLHDSGGRLDWGLLVISKMIRSGLPFSECLERMHNVTEACGSLAATNVYSDMGDAYDVLRVARITNKDHLVRIAKLIAGERQGKKPNLLNYYKVFCMIMYFGVVQAGLTPDEIAEKIITLAARYSDGDKLFEAAGNNLLPAEAGEPESGVVLIKAKEKDRYFAKIEGKLIHNLMPYQINKGFDEGMADLRKLAKKELPEGFWVFAPETNTWYSLGGEKDYSPGSGRVRQEILPYDISQLSNVPVFVHIHPEEGEIMITIAREVLNHKQFQVRLTKYCAVMPSRADFGIIADLLKESTGSIDGLKNYIVNSLGTTEVVCPWQEIDKVEEMSENFSALRDAVTLQFDTDTYLAQGLDEGEFDFAKRLEGDLNETLPQGFRVTLLPADTKFKEDIARLKSKRKDYSDIETSNARSHEESEDIIDADFEVVNQDSTSSAVGGLDLNTDKANVNLLGQSSDLQFSNSGITINPDTFEGFTYQMLKMEKFADISP